MIPSYEEAITFLGNMPEIAWLLVLVGFGTACRKFWVRRQTGTPFFPLYLCVGVLPTAVIWVFAATFKQLLDTAGIVVIPLLVGGMFLVLPFSVGFVLGGAVFGASTPIMSAPPKE